MKAIALRISLLCSILCTCCNAEPEPVPDPCPEPELVEFRENFSEDEFENAIIGTWTSAFEWEDNVNVMFLKIDCENNAEIHLEENGQSKIYVGDLNIQYVRQIGPGYVTRAQLIITTKDEEIILSDVGFGKNNMISAENLYLRNYDSPHATLEWGLE